MVTSVDIHAPQVITGTPVNLYKFASLEDDKRLGWFEGVVVRGEFYFAHPLELNDPFECRPRFIPSAVTNDPALLRVKLQLYLQSQGLSHEQIRMLPQRPPEEAARELSKAYRRPDGEQQNVQMFCMTTTRDHPLLWAHYADGHRGACVHLDQHYIPFPAARAVHYEADYPVVPILDEPDPDEVYRRVLFVKGPEWKYEGEYRVIRYFRSPTVNMDMQWKGQIAQASPNTVIGVTLGARISPENQTAVLAMVKRRAKPVPVWKAEPHEERFGFVFTKIFR